MSESAMSSTEIVICVVGGLVAIVLLPFVVKTLFWIMGVLGRWLVVTGLIAAVVFAVYWFLDEDDGATPEPPRPEEGLVLSLASTPQSVR